MSGKVQLPGVRYWAKPLIPNSVAMPYMCAACGWAPPKPNRWGAFSVHHLTPKASGGADSQANKVRLCRRCHVAAHKHFGDGHDYHGPTSKEAFIVAIRAATDGDG